MTHTLHSLRTGSRLVCWALATACFFLLFPRAALAQTYVNSQNVSYSEPGPPYVPQIDATAFDNQNVFDVTYNIIENNQMEFCEPWWGTLYYTNVGEMMVNAPIPTNGDFNTLTSGVGYRFDLQEGNSNVMAGTFYNPGIIHCDSTLDGNNTFFFEGLQLAGLNSIGDCFVSATNIINPGLIEIGIGGQLNLNGQNVDLSRSVLTLEQGVANSNNVDANLVSEREGFDTNGDWDPAEDLANYYAYSSLPDNLYLTFQTSYIEVTNLSPSNILVRAVFIVNANTNVQSSVYIAPGAFGDDGALIQWAGGYPDPATGVTDTNYLYLFHYYFNSTNLPQILAVGAVPGQGFGGNYASFLWSQNTPYPDLPQPTPAGFQPIFNNNTISNQIYEYFNADLTGTTVGTNVSGVNPSGALTNLPNRLIINASRDLKMNLAQISGANYMSITATNQFDGSPGAVISCPYSDLNLAVTNGTLTVSNLLAASIPQWGGSLNEWSTRWTNTDANGIVWDYRVMLVYANLTPAISPQVQNLTLTATNLVISDILNVFGSTFANARSLTLTANPFGAGARSPDGELNLQQQEPDYFNWNTSFPNVSFLTNDGAIRLPNFGNFVSSSAVTEAVPAIAAVAATNVLFESGGKNVANGSTVVIGGITYTFTNLLKSPDSVAIGANFDASLTNLMAAINAGRGAGTVYASGTYANPSVTTGLLLTNVSLMGDTITNHGFIVMATIPGTDPGNQIATSTTATNLIWTNSAFGVTLTGGVDAITGSTNFVNSVSPFAAIINNGLIWDEGSTLWVSNFVNGGAISNGTGSFLLTASDAMLTNGMVNAGGDITLAANTLIISNVVIDAGRSLTFDVTNTITDGSVSNGNIFTVGVTNETGFNGQGLDLPFLPTNTVDLPFNNNLLGSSIYMQSPPPNQQVSSTWAGLDYGATTNGYNTNNMAIGQLILSSMGSDSVLYFSGPPSSTTSNAIYVERLILLNYASLAAREGSAGIPALQFSPNFTIYYGDAQSSESVNGGPLIDVSSILNGLNGNHLQWVPSEVSGFSGMDVHYSNGSVNRLNAGLATGGGNSQLDSTGSGVPNGESSDPVFVSSQINFHVFHVGDSNKLVWNSTPGATNYVYFCTTNFASWNVAAVITNSAVVPPPGGWPITNILYEPITVSTGANSATNNCYYRVKVIQDNAIYQGE